MSHVFSLNSTIDFTLPCRWMLYGDDDTMFFSLGVQKLLEGLDPEMPYIIVSSAKLCCRNCLRPMWLCNLAGNARAPCGYVTALLGFAHRDCLEGGSYNYPTTDRYAKKQLHALHAERNPSVNPTHGHM